MNRYVIKRTVNVPDSEEWKLANVAEINLKPWKQGVAHFNSYARLLYDDDAIYVRMESDEMPVVARHTERHSFVCTDSCVEFFFCPDQNRNFYINFEVNALGTLLIGAGEAQTGRIRCMDDEKIFDVKPQLCENGWKISFKIPFDFITKYAGGYTMPMRGNFYKCGSETGHRHYGVWNMVETEVPDFHQPEYFGELAFEK